MAASFYSSPLIGATTTLACFAHEIPHEIADYSILIRSGFTKKQAMQSQFLTAIGAFVRAFPPSSFPLLPMPGWTGRRTLTLTSIFSAMLPWPGYVMSCHGTAHTGRVR